MAQQPPLLPQETFERLLDVAYRDGRLLLFLGGAYGLLSALQRESASALLGCAIAGAGAWQIHGANLLAQGSLQGLAHLLRSQLLLPGLFALYLTLRFLSPPSAEALAALSPEQKAELLTSLSEPQLIQVLRALYFGFYSVLALVGFLYLTSNFLYYYRRRQPVSLALHTDDL